MQYRQDLHLKSNTVSFLLLPNAIKTKLTIKGHLPNVISPNSYNPRPLKLRVGTPNICSSSLKANPHGDNILSSPSSTIVEQRPTLNSVPPKTSSVRPHNPHCPRPPILTSPYPRIPYLPAQYQFLPFHPISNSHSHLHVIYFRTRLWYIGCNRFFHPILIRTKKYLKI